MALLEVSQLQIAYRAGPTPVCVLDEAAFSIGEGECLGLMGESGSGKTSLAGAILRVLPPTAQVRGSIRFRGVELLALAHDAMRGVRGAQVALIWQEPSTALHPLLRVADQVAEVIRAHRPVTRDSCRTEALAALERAGLQGHRIFHSYPHQLSGGERQRVLIALAIACAPALVIADEPTSALDTATQSEIAGLLAGLRKDLGISLLWISHNLPLLEQVADRIVRIHDRRIVETAVAPPRRASAPRRTASSGEPALLTVRGLRKTYGGRSFSWRQSKDTVVLDGVDLTLRRGATLALAGASGSGKTTLARCVARLDTPGGGEIRLEGREIGQLRGEQLRAVRPSVQLIQQDPASSLPPRLTAAEIVEEPLAIQRRGTAAERRQRALYWMSETGLPAGSARRRSHEFSGGQRARLAIARALAMEPRLLILDESLSSLDTEAQERVMELLRDLAERHQVGCLVIAHDLALVARMADEVAVLDGGRIVEYGPAGEVLRAPRHPQTQRLVLSIPGRGRA